MSLRLGLTMWEAGSLASGSRASCWNPPLSGAHIRRGFEPIHRHDCRSTFSTSSSKAARSASSPTRQPVPRYVPAPPMPKSKSDQPKTLSPSRTPSHTASPPQTETNVPFWRVLFRKSSKTIPEIAPAPAQKAWREPKDWPWQPLSPVDDRAHQKLVFARPFESGKNTNPLRMFLEVFLTGVAWSTVLVWRPKWLWASTASIMTVNVCGDIRRQLHTVTKISVVRQYGMYQTLITHGGSDVLGGYRSRFPFIRRIVARLRKGSTTRLLVDPERGTLYRSSKDPLTRESRSTDTILVESTDHPSHPRL